MKKRLSFLYRYLTASRHFRLWRARWISLQTLLVVGIIAAFWSTLTWSAPISSALEHDLAGASGVKGGAMAKVLAEPLVEAQLPIPNTGRQVQPAQQATPNPELTLQPTRTPLPAEYISNSNETVGITVASVVLVIIVIVGVLLLPRREEQN